MNKVHITENEKKEILKSHMSNNVLNDIVITDWLSPDEKYCIFLDELYDIQNKILLGNIWENFDYFKMFLKHSFEVSKTISEEIRESVLSEINSLVLTESSNNMTILKPFVKQFLNEESNASKLWGDFTTWGKDTIKGAISGVTDFAKTSWEGLKKTYSYIKDGDWRAAFDIIKKGALYVARKIRAALYNPIGLILDAILVATGIGKGFQIGIWAIVVGLDLYELSTGNYEDKEMAMGWRLLFLGVDIMGLVFAGMAAKAAKKVVEGSIKTFGKSEQGLVNAANKSPEIKGIIERVLSAAQGASGKINQAVATLKTKSPMMGKWLGGLINLLGGFLKKMTNGLSIIFKGGSRVVKAAGAPGRVVRKALGQETRLGKGSQALVNVGGLVAGVGTYEQGQKKKESEELAAAEQELVKTIMSPESMVAIDKGAEDILKQYGI
jgi:hypothetical protein